MLGSSLAPGMRELAQQLHGPGFILRLKALSSPETLPPKPLVPCWCLSPFPCVSAVCLPSTAQMRWGGGREASPEWES